MVLDLAMYNVSSNLSREGVQETTPQATKQLVENFLVPPRSTTGSGSIPIFHDEWIYI